MREWFLEQLAMYAAYHRDLRNQATHHVGVPLIVYALMLALTQIPIIASVSAATIVIILLLGFYLVNVPLVGGLAVLIYGILYGVAARVGEAGADVVWSTFAACFVGGWIIQFIGHVFEGRRPALFDNAVQVFMAPPFLIAELLFVFGAAQDLAAQIDRRHKKYLPSSTPMHNAR